MLTIGLTGGIGSGKSTLAKIFSDLGITVINLDDIARDLVAIGTPALARITEHFGTSILFESGALNRSALRQRIFASNDEREWLEALLHPLIKKEQARQLSQARSPYVVVEIPLLTENNLKDTVDRVLVVDVPESIQIARTQSRDQVAADDVRHILDAQASRQERLSIADDVVTNDGTLEDLKGAALLLHRRYLALTPTYAAQ